MSQMVDIRQPDLDAAAVLAKLDARLQEHRALWRRLPSFFPSYADLLKQTDRPPTNALEYYVWRLAQTDVSVTPHLIPSRLPVIWRAVDWIKGEFHRLVLYYVNILAGKQSMYNAQVYQVLRRLAANRSTLERDEEEPETDNGSVH